MNALASGEAEDLERLAGMAFLNGIRVRLEPVAQERAASGAAPELASAGS